QMSLQVMSRGLLMRSGQGEFSKADDKAGDAHLGADIQKLGNDPLDQMWMRERAAQLRGGCLPGVLLADLGQLRHPDEQGHEEKYGGDEDIGNLHNVRFRDLVSGQLRRAHGSEFPWGVFDARKDESGS